MITNEMIEQLLTHIKEDYYKFQLRMYREISNKEDMYLQIERFNGSLRYTTGKNYIKVIREGSVHSFIVLEDNKQFKQGDILKAASWNAPAKNKARGNIITGDLSNVNWCGTEYLR